MFVVRCSGSFGAAVVDVGGGVVSIAVAVPLSRLVTTAGRNQHGHEIDAVVPLARQLRLVGEEFEVLRQDRLRG